MKRPTDAQVEYIPQLVEKFHKFCNAHDDRPQKERRKWESVIYDSIKNVKSWEIKGLLENLQISCDGGIRLENLGSERPIENQIIEDYRELQTEAFPKLLNAIDKFEAFLREKGYVGKCVEECHKLKEKVGIFQKEMEKLYNAKPEKRRQNAGKKKKSGAAKFFTFVLFCVTVFVVYKVYVASKVAMQ